MHTVIYRPYQLSALCWLRLRVHSWFWKVGQSPYVVGRPLDLGYRGLASTASVQTVL